MSPTSPELQALLRHYAGPELLQDDSYEVFLRPRWFFQNSAAEKAQRDLPFPGRLRANTFVGAPEHPRLFSGLSESYGKKEFDAAICFIDMVGFTEKARGKAPKEISAIVSPFLCTVITAAKESKCYVDKTIGDEVMVVMPALPLCAPCPVRGFLEQC